MSSGVVDETEEHADPHGEHGAHHTDSQYIKIALILAVVTAVEVGLFYTSFSEGLTNLTLMVLAGIKFVLVAAYFMHLKFDNKIVRRIFTTGVVLAFFVYILYLLTLGVFR